MKNYDQLQVDDHKKMASDLYVILGHTLNAIVEEVSIEEHPENDGERMYIDLQLKDEIDDEKLVEAVVTAYSLMNSLDAFND